MFYTEMKVLWTIVTSYQAENRRCVDGDSLPGASQQTCYLVCRDTPSTTRLIICHHTTTVARPVVGIEDLRKTLLGLREQHRIVGAHQYHLHLQ